MGFVLQTTTLVTEPPGDGGADSGKVFPNRGKLFPFRKYRDDTKGKQEWNVR